MTEFAEFALVMTPVIPLGAAALAFMLPRFAILVTTIAALAVAAAVATVITAIFQTNPLIHPMGSWGLPLGIELRVDGISAVLLGLTAVVMGAATLYGRAYFADQSEGNRYFWPLWLFLWAALNAIFVSEDAFNIYVGLELLGLASVGLTAMGDGPQASQAALRYMIVGLVGSLFYLLAVALVYLNIGTVDLPGLAERLAAAGPVGIVALGLATTGLILKTALFPLHFWLPPAHANAPAPVSAALSALVVKASFYILLRFWFDADGNLIFTNGASFLGILGGLAVLWGATRAMAQDRLKPLVAYSTVAQIGYLFLVFPIVAGGGETYLGWTGMLYLVVAHGVAKSAMFLSAGTMRHLVGHDRIDGLAGIGFYAPLSVFAFAAAGVSLIGLPPSGGFIAKWLLLNGALANRQWLIVAVLLVGGLLAAGYVFRVIKETFRREPRTTGSHRADPWLEWTAAALGMLALALGFLAPLLLPLLGGNGIPIGSSGAG